MIFLPAFYSTILVGLIFALGVTFMQYSTKRQSDRISNALSMRGYQGSSMQFRVTSRSRIITWLFGVVVASIIVFVFLAFISPFAYS